VAHVVKLLALGVVLVVGTPAYGAGHRIGSTVRSHWALPLRKSPPSFFRGLAPQVGSTKPSQDYTVLDNMTVPNVTGEESWVELRPNSGGEVGWSYDGKSKSTCGNLEEVK
jgi:hypothetical protein